MPREVPRCRVVIGIAVGNHADFHVFGVAPAEVVPEISDIGAVEIGHASDCKRYRVVGIHRHAAERIRLTAEREVNIFRMSVGIGFL